MKLPLREGPLPFIDGDGVSCLRVILAQHQGTAEIDRETFERLMATGVSPYWHLNEPGSRGSYGQVKSHHSKRGTVILAREALRLSKGDGLRACFRNGNRTDLRRSNLYAEPNPNRPILGMRRTRPKPAPAPSVGRREGPFPEGTLQVSLGRSGKLAVIDQDDYQRLVEGGLGRSWYAVPNGRGRDYVYANHRERGTVRVPREIMGLRRGDGCRVRHLDGNWLNLRQSNLAVDEPGTRKIKTQRHRQ